MKCHTKDAANNAYNDQITHRDRYWRIWKLHTCMMRAVHWNPSMHSRWVRRKQIQWFSTYWRFVKIIYNRCTIFLTHSMHDVLFMNRRKKYFFLSFCKTFITCIKSGELACTLHSFFWQKLHQLIKFRNDESFSQSYHHHRHLCPCASNS